MEVEATKILAFPFIPSLILQFQSISYSCFLFLSLLFLLRSCLMIAVRLMKKIWLISRLSHLKGQLLKHLCS